MKHQTILLKPLDYITDRTFRSVVLSILFFLIGFGILQPVSAQEQRSPEEAEEIMVSTYQKYLKRNPGNDAYAAYFCDLKNGTIDKQWLEEVLKNGPERVKMQALHSFNTRMITSIIIALLLGGVIVVCFHRVFQQKQLGFMCVFRFYYLTWLVLISILLGVFFFLIKTPVCIHDIFRLGSETNDISLSVSLFFTFVMLWVIAAVFYFVRIDRTNFLFWVGTLSIAGLYLSFLREHVQFGDYGDYIYAAENILNNQPFHSRYIYPPFWAFVLARVFLISGFWGTSLFCFGMTYLSIVVFYVLGCRMLWRFSLSLNTAAVLLFVAMCINVPLLRNIVYVQINFLMIDCILASILLLRKTWLSAFLMAMGVILKVIPVTFVPLFIIARQWKWLCGFTCALICLVLLPILFDGYSYLLDFLRNLTSWEPTYLRSCSIHDLLQNQNMLFRYQLNENLWSLLFKLPLLFVLLLFTLISIQKKSFVSDANRVREMVLNGFVPLCFSVPILAPTVWIHHLVILILPAILIAIRIKQPFWTLLVVVSWFCVFWLPAFDIYPWSYLRLTGWVGLFASMGYVVFSGSEINPVVERLNTLL